jgi:hypothetical protein
MEIKAQLNIFALISLLHISLLAAMTFFSSYLTLLGSVVDPDPQGAETF